MSIYKYKEIELHGCFYYYGNVWHLLAFIGNYLAHNGFAFNGLLCIILIKVIQMQESNQYWGINGNGTKPFFPALFNPSRRADYLFDRTEQVVFRGTRNEFRASKQLALAGA